MGIKSTAAFDSHTSPGRENYNILKVNSEAIKSLSSSFGENERTELQRVS